MNDRDDKDDKDDKNMIGGGMDMDIGGGMGGNDDDGGVTDDKNKDTAKDKDKDGDGYDYKYDDADLEKLYAEYAKYDIPAKHVSPAKRTPQKTPAKHVSPAKRTPHKTPARQSHKRSPHKDDNELFFEKNKNKNNNKIIPTPPASTAAQEPVLRVEMDDVRMIEDMEALTPKNRTKLFINVTFLNVLIHVCILWTFLSIFFFFIASKLSSNGMNKVLSSSVGTAVDGFLNNLNKKEADALYILLKPVQLNQLSVMFSSPDKTMETNNLWDKKFSFAIAGGLLAMFLITAFVFKVLCRKNLSIWQVLIENFIMFFFVGCVEYSFFKYIASQYMPIMPSTISSQVDLELKNAF